MIKSLYNLCYLYIFSSFGMIKIQTNDILVSANNIFANIKENLI